MGGMGGMSVGSGTPPAAVLEVSTRLLHEGSSRIDADIDSALVGLRQSFTIECQYSESDESGGRLCRSCAAYCRALTKANHGEAPAAAVPVLLQALDVLAERRAAGNRAEAAEAFVMQELLGLANHLSGITTQGTDPASPKSASPGPQTASGLEVCHRQGTHCSAHIPCPGCGV